MKHVLWCSTQTQSRNNCNCLPFSTWPFFLRHSAVAFLGHVLRRRQHGDEHEHSSLLSRLFFNLHTGCTPGVAPLCSYLKDSLQFSFTPICLTIKIKKEHNIFTKIEGRLHFNNFCVVAVIACIFKDLSPSCSLQKSLSNALVFQGSKVQG